MSERGVGDSMLRERKSSKCALLSGNSNSPQFDRRYLSYFGRRVGSVYIRKKMINIVSVTIIESTRHLDYILMYSYTADALRIMVNDRYRHNHDIFLIFKAPRGMGHADIPRDIQEMHVKAPLSVNILK